MGFREIWRVGSYSPHLIRVYAPECRKNNGGFSRPISWIPSTLLGDADSRAPQGANRKPEAEKNSCILAAHASRMQLNRGNMCCL